MAINRYISFLFMLITVLSSHPDNISDSRNISDVDLYRHIIKSSLELSQSRQSLKTSERLLFRAQFAQKGSYTQRLFVVLKENDTLNQNLYSSYHLTLNHQSIISMQRNDIWRHAVF